MILITMATIILKNKKGHVRYGLRLHKQKWIGSELDLL